VPRYVVERTFAEGLAIAADGDGARRCLELVEKNSDQGVTWIHSYVSEDSRRTFCVYEAATPEAVRRAAARNDLPVDRITQVRVLDPYFHR
jgi:hypothetical protein